MGFLSFYFVVLKTDFCEEEITVLMSKTCLLYGLSFRLFCCFEDRFLWGRNDWWSQPVCLEKGGVCFLFVCFFMVWVLVLWVHSQNCVYCLCDHSVRICNSFFTPVFSAQRGCGIGTSAAVAPWPSLGGPVHRLVRAADAWWGLWTSSKMVWP